MRSWPARALPTSTSTSYLLVDNIVTTYDAHKLMANGIRTSNAGSKPWEYTEQQCRLFLVSALLTIYHDPTLTIRRLHETLTQGLSNTSQLELER